MPMNPFCVAINCIDGRAQQPVWDFLRYFCNTQYVDMITEPGVDKCLREGSDEAVEAIKSKVKLSIHGHGSNTVAVVGHYDCLINPASREQHLADITQAAKVVESWGLPARVVGLYVNEWLTVELVSDTVERAIPSHL
jgi:hypothetical protein